MRDYYVMLSYGVESSSTGDRQEVAHYFPAEYGGEILALEAAREHAQRIKGIVCEHAWSYSDSVMIENYQEEQELA